MNRTLTLVMLCLFGVVGFALGKDKDKATEQRVEIKYLVPPDDIAKTCETLGVDRDHPDKIRVECFYDTDKMELFSRVPKVILRSRYSTSSDNNVDTTVKIRGGPKLSGEEVKDEFDEVIGNDSRAAGAILPMVESYSLIDKSQDRKEIESANKGMDIRKVFAGKQEEFLGKANIHVEWNRLIPYGPVNDVQIWEDISAGGVDEITVEQWELPERNGKGEQTLFEVSTKVDASKEPQTKEALCRLLQITGLATKNEETKTKIVLERYSGSGSDTVPSASVTPR